MKQSKANDLLHEFGDYKVETVLNFEAIRQQLQTNQSKNSAKFEVFIQLLESLKAEIQTLRQQPSSSATQFLSPLTEYTPPHSPFLGNDHSGGEDEDLPMASLVQHHEELEVLPTKDTPPQDHNRTKSQMTLNDQSSVAQIPKIIHVESDEEPVMHLVEAPIDVENVNRDKSEAATDEEMVDAETIDEKLEKKIVEETLSEAAKEMSTRESK